MDDKKIGRQLNMEELEKVAGGASLVDIISNASCPNCGERKNIECLGVDPGRRTVYLKCLNEWCLKEFTVNYE